MCGCVKCGASKLGTEGASLCTGCGEASVAGASFSAPAVAGMTCASIAAVLLFVALARRISKLRTPRLALA